MSTLAYFVSRVPARPMALPAHTRRLVCRCGAAKDFVGTDAQIGSQIITSGWLPGGTARTALDEAAHGIPSDCPRCRAQFEHQIRTLARA